MRMTLYAAVAWAMVASTSNATHAETVAPSNVQFKDNAVDLSLTGKPGNPAEGKKWVVNGKLGNCLACHKNEDMKDQLFHGDFGPPLDGAGTRWTAGQLRAILVNSKMVFGEATVMPAFYRDSGFNKPLKQFVGKTVLSAEQIEDIVAYLITLKEK